jgi:ArsR family transcriptional regulator
MSYSKAEQFKVSEQTLADFARALSHPARIMILKTLAERKQCICGELVEVLPLAQSTVSQHLKALREGGLIAGEIEGPRSCYCLDPQAVQKLSELLEEFIRVLRNATKPDCC